MILENFIVNKTLILFDNFIFIMLVNLSKLCYIKYVSVIHLVDSAYLGVNAMPLG